MMFKRLLITSSFSYVCCCLLLLACAASALEWSVYQNFPTPAPGAYGVVGTALPDGRLLLWNGDTVYLQNTIDADAFTEIASGYSGDPSFIALSPDGHTLLLGAGTGDFFNPPDWKDSLYRFDLANPADYTPDAVAMVHPHYHGAFLDGTRVLVDLGKADFSGSELAILDIAQGAKSLGAVVRKSAKYDRAKELVLNKPPFSYSGNVAVDTANGIAYAMDSNTLELRFFSVDALLAAHENSETLDWETDGTLVGEAGAFFSNGVNGITPESHLVISGSLGFLQPGGIQLVNPNHADPAQASILSTEDPAGNQPYYAAIYSPGTDTITAHDFVNWYASKRNLNDGLHHSADINQDGRLSLSELLRLVQLYNMGGFSCAPTGTATEDGYVAMPGGLQNCASHTVDYAPRNWQIELAELLRAIQLYRMLGYTPCPTAFTEDGFCPNT